MDDIHRRLTAVGGGGDGRVPDEAPEEVNAVIDSCLNTADADSRPSALDLVNFFTVWGGDGEAAAQRSSSLLDVAARRSCSLSSGLSSGEPLSGGRRSVSDIGPIPEADPDEALSRASARAGPCAGPSMRSATPAHREAIIWDRSPAGQAGSSCVPPSLPPAQPVPAVAGAAHEAARSAVESRAEAGQAAGGSGAAAEASVPPPAQRPALPGRASPFAAAAGA